MATSDFLLDVFLQSLTKEYDRLGYWVKAIPEETLVFGTNDRIVLDADTAILSNYAITDPFISVTLSSPDNFFTTSRLSFALSPISRLQTFSQYINISLSATPIGGLSLYFLRLKPIKK